MAKPTVAIIGRPNVGKSTIFNKIIGDRLSIVEDVAGVTRDRIYSKAEWLNYSFFMIDTGGIELEDTPFQKQIRAQAELAIDEADVIIFLTNGRDGVTSDDEEVAKLLYKTDKPVVLAVNKIDNFDMNHMIYDFYSLGFGDPFPISGSHGLGIGDLLDEVCKNFKVLDEEEEDEKIRFSLIGRPNVGKSSLINTILGEERVIASDIAGTTRDAIDTDFKHNGDEYVVIDTAGIRKRGKVYEACEKYSVLRSLKAIERSDVVLVVLNAEEGIIGSDYRVDLKIYADLKKAIQTDELIDTVDYVHLNKIVKEEMAIRAKLLENVAGRISDRIFSELPQVQKLKLKIAKVNPPIGGDVAQVIVKIKRKRFGS